jgi:hypothetical protein
VEIITRPLEIIGLILMLWSCHVLIAGVLSAPIVLFGRKRARWEARELFAFVLPFSFWMLLSFFGSQPKSMANFSEAFYIAFPIPLAALGRVVLGGDKKQLEYSWLWILFLCAVAIATYFLVPSLPE